MKITHIGRVESNLIESNRIENVIVLIRTLNISRCAENRSVYLYQLTSYVPTWTPLSHPNDEVYIYRLNAM